MRFQDQTALVTGGGTGIGKGIVERLVSEGAHVFALGRTRSTLEESVTAANAVGPGRAEAVEMDLTSEDSMLAAVNQIIAAVGRIDVLVNNAATNYDAPVTEFPTAEWDRVMATNLTGPMILSREVGKQMVSQGGGAIVNVSSADAHLSQPRASSYDASKAGLNALTRTMALEQGPNGIRVNSVSPGLVITPMSVVDYGPELAEYLETNFERAPLGRGLNVAEVAAAVAFLASPEASGITGADLCVDAGLTAGSYVVETLPEL